MMPEQGRAVRARHNHASEPFSPLRPVGAGNSSMPCDLGVRPKP
jgi:hypothetical protein